MRDCHGCTGFITLHGIYSYSNYTKVFNALDYSACIFPVTRVDVTKDVKKPAHTFLSNLDETNYNLCTLFHYGDSSLSP